MELQVEGMSAAQVYKQIQEKSAEISYTVNQHPLDKTYRCFINPFLGWEYTDRTNFKNNVNRITHIEGSNKIAPFVLKLYKKGKEIAIISYAKGYEFYIQNGAKVYFSEKLTDLVERLIK